MNKIIVLIACMLVWSPWALAQGSAAPAGEYRLGSPFEGDVAFGYRWVTRDGSRTAGEYEYLHSSLTGRADIEYDPLPNRVFLETVVNNAKDYFTEFDYSYSDIVMVNFIGRQFYRNLHHLELPPGAPLSSATDLNPGEDYFSETGMNRVQLRLKAPDFPLHLYLEGKTLEKHGTMQQRFMRSFTSGDRMSQSRNIDFETTEGKVTVNSHLNLLEVEFSHAQKEFKNTQDKAMTDTAGANNVTYAHNQYSGTEASTDTIKVHTSHTGRVAATATYSSGQRENKDSGVKADFVNAGAELTWVPDKSVTVALRYRHQEVTPEGPQTVSSITSLGSMATFTVRDAIGTKRDAMTGFVRYRATDRLTLRAEVVYDKLTRDFTATEWTHLDEELTRLTARLGATYRFTNRLMFRGDVSHQAADIPQTSVDNTYYDTTDTARGLLTWSPAAWYNLMLSGATVREKRDQAAPPFTGAREAERNRGQAAMTFLIGKRTAVVPSYAFLQNKQTSPVAYAGPLSSITVESGVPYADTAHLASLTVTHSATDVMTLSAEALRSWSRGGWRNSGAVSGTSGIAVYSDLHVIETELGGDVMFRFSKNLATELTYRYRTIDDKQDNAETGTAQILFATMKVLW